MKSDEIKARITAMEQELKTLREALEHVEIQQKEEEQTSANEPPPPVSDAEEESRPKRKYKPRLFRSDSRHLKPPYINPFEMLIFDFYDERVNLGMCDYNYMHLNIPEYNLVHDGALREVRKGVFEEIDSRSFQFAPYIRVYEWPYIFMEITPFRDGKAYAKYALLDLSHLPSRNDLRTNAKPVYGTLRVRLNDKPYWATIPGPEGAKKQNSEKNEDE